MERTLEMIPRPTSLCSWFHHLLSLIEACLFDHPFSLSPPNFLKYFLTHQHPLCWSLLTVKNSLNFTIPNKLFYISLLFHSQGPRKKCSPSPSTSSQRWEDPWVWNIICDVTCFCYVSCIYLHFFSSFFFLMKILCYKGYFADIVEGIQAENKAKLKNERD